MICMIHLFWKRHAKKISIKFYESYAWWYSICYFWRKSNFDVTAIGVENENMNLFTFIDDNDDTLDLINQVEINNDDRLF